MRWQSDDRPIWDGKKTGIPELFTSGSLQFQQAEDTEQSQAKGEKNLENFVERSKKLSEAQVKLWFKFSNDKDESSRASAQGNNSEFSSGIN